jgi:hypothetical protein
VTGRASTQFIGASPPIGISVPEQAKLESHPFRNRHGSAGPFFEIEEWHNLQMPHPEPIKGESSQPKHQLGAVSS